MQKLKKINLSFMDAYNFKQSKVYALPKGGVCF